MQKSLSAFDMWASPESGNIRLSGKIVGAISWSIHHEADFENFNIPQNYPSGFDYYRKQMQHDVFPVIYLRSLVIYEEYRQRGYGSDALRVVLKREKRKGARTAFMRVSDNDWKLKWYGKEGFRLLVNEQNCITVPYMWHSLHHLNRCPPKVSVGSSADHRH